MVEKVGWATLKGKESDTHIFVFSTNQRMWSQTDQSKKNGLQVDTWSTGEEKLFDVSEKPTVSILKKWKQPVYLKFLIIHSVKNFAFEIIVLGRCKLVSV
jgi:hypothetical protein